MDVRYETEQRGADAEIVRLKGRLDMATAADIRQHFADAVADGRIRIVVDMHDVTFMDSSGLGALISGLKSARAGGGELRIARVGDQPRSVLRLTSLLQVLTPYTDVETALA